MNTDARARWWVIIAAVIMAIILAVIVTTGARAASCDPVDFYRVDESFDAGDLTGDLAIWYDRTWDVLLDPTPGANWPAILAHAGEGNSYRVGRNTNRVVSGMMSLFRRVGEEALLDSARVIAEEVRADLVDAWGDGTTDGYLGLWWTQAEVEPYFETDLHWDELFVASWLAELAWALQVNAHLDPAYAEAASFWTGYLWNHYQAKWLARNGAVDPLDPTDAELDQAWHTDSAFGISKSLWHPYMAQAKLAHFMYLLYGNPWHLGERDDILAQWRADLVTLGGGTRVAWPHVPGENPVTGDEGYQKMNYVAYTWVSLDLFLDLDLLDDGALYAAAFAHVFDQEGADEMAERIDGSTTTESDETEGEDCTLTSPCALDPYTFGSAAQYGSYAAIEAVVADNYVVTSSLDAEIASWMAAGASEE